MAERQLPRIAFGMAAAVLLAAPGVSQAADVRVGPPAADGVRSVGVVVADVEYEGRPALEVAPAKAMPDTEENFALLPAPEAGDFELRADLAGAPTGVNAFARGFVGIAFHVADDLSRFEAIYLRPTSGRANDQLRRNHSTQYFSYPDYPWSRLRREAPGVYESYTDLVPGAWTSVRIVVKGSRAELYVNDASQPCLIVKDLKLGPAKGRFGLWVGPGTVAHFSNISIVAD